MAGEGLVTRAMVFTLDPSPAEERLLRSYCGAARKAYNWALGEVTANLAAREAERAVAVPEDHMTPMLSWSAWSLSKRWNAVKDLEAPWWREVSMHAFRSGLTAAANALENWHESRTGKRKGRRMGFPRFKTKKNALLSVSFVEINHQLSWLHPDRHHVRLMLPQSAAEPDLRRRRQYLGWVHTVEPTGQLYRLIDEGLGTIQKVTISLRGGRWRASFQVRYQTPSTMPPARRLGAMVGIDVGLRHLATLSQPVPGLTDEDGHIPNPNVLEGQLQRLRKLDRQITRAQPHSKSQGRLIRRRARLHGRIKQTRALHLHSITTSLASGFDVVVVEDLNLTGMSNRKHHLGRRFADAGLGELRQQLRYKTVDRGHHLVTVSRFYPSSRICSFCEVTKAKLPLSERVFTCNGCGAVIDRDINAARNVVREAVRLLGLKGGDQKDGAGLRPDSVNATPRPRKTPAAPAKGAGSPEGGTKQPRLREAAA